MMKGACSFPPYQGSNLTVHACHLRGALHAHWVCRMFSEPWDYSWCAQAGLDTHVNQKKKKKNYYLGRGFSVTIEFDDDDSMQVFPHFSLAWLTQKPWLRGLTLALS